MTTQYVQAVKDDFAKVMQAYDELREWQVEKLHKRSYTMMDRIVTGLMFMTVNKAVEDVALDSAKMKWSGIALRAIPLDTGTGKTQSVLAYIVNATKIDRQFSAVYVAASIQGLLDVMQDLILLGIRPAVSFSNPSGRYDVEAAAAGACYVKDRSELKDHQVVLVTHKFWSEDTKNMLTNYRGWRRSLVVIDEQPELVEVRRCKAAQVQTLLQRLTDLDRRADWRAVLTEVVSRMNRTALLPGQTFTPEGLITKHEAAVLGMPSHTDLEQYIPKGLSEPLRIKEVESMREVFRFLSHAFEDTCFYSRREREFFSYRPKFDPKPGHILLDATADLHELVVLMPGAELVTVPKITYENLTLLHVDHPKEFRSRAVTKSAKGAAPYAAWIKAIVLANSNPEDDVLIVTHKNLVEYKYLDAASGWDGRKVDIVWWGGPFGGTNRYKDKTHVFCFEEAHRPRSIDVADIHGVSAIPLTKTALKEAESVRAAGDEFAPTGIYLSPWEGRLLAMTKQAAMRGRARNIDEDFRVGPMVLLTTMPIKRLDDNLASLFPGAPRVTPGKDAHGKPGSTSLGAGRKAPNRTHLLRLELGRTMLDQLSSQDIERLTGIPTNELGKYFAKADVRGWKLVSASELDLPGRAKYVVREAVREAA